MSDNNASYSKKVEYMLNNYMEIAMRNSRYKYFRKLQKLNKLKVIPIDNIEEYPDTQILYMLDCIDDEIISDHTIELAFTDKAKHDFIKRMPDKYKYMIFYKVLCCKDNVDIAKMLGISKQAINGLQNKIIDHIKNKYGNGCHPTLKDSLAKNHKSFKKKGDFKMSKKNCF